VSGAVFQSATPGSGSAVAGGAAEDDMLLEYLRVHHNAGAGVTNMEGKITRSELFENTENPDAAGFIGAAVKGSHEYEASNLYVHDNYANGLWCDNGCQDVPSQANGAWFHDNVVVKNGRYGIRFEEAPDLADTGTPPTHLAEGNLIAENGIPKIAGDSSKAGGSAHDVSNTTWRNNAFGPQEIAGLGAVGHNANSKAILFTDSGRSDRPDLRNADAYGNALNGETIKNCDMADDIVDCHDNTA
jgi:hypothetical protein